MPELYPPAGNFQEGYEVGLTTAVDSTPEYNLESELIANRSDNCPSELGPSFRLALIHRLRWDKGLLFAWFYILPYLNVRAVLPQVLWGACHRRRGCGGPGLPLPGRYLLQHGRGSRHWSSPCRPPGGLGLPRGDPGSSSRGPGSPVRIATGRDCQRVSLRPVLWEGGHRSA